MRTDIPPQPVSFALIVTDTQTDARGAHAAPFDASMGIFRASVREHGAGNRPPRRHRGPADILPVTAVGQAADPIHHRETERRGADIAIPGCVFVARAEADAAGPLTIITVALITAATGAE